jgi:WD40 repeat protein
MVWDFNDHALIHASAAHSDIVWGVAWSADCIRAISCSSNKELKVWNFQDYLSGTSQRNHPYPFFPYSLSADGQKVIIRSSNQTLTIMDTQSSQVIHLLDCGKKIIWSAALSADGHRAAAGFADGKIQVWDLENNLAWERKCFTRWVHTLKFSADGRWVISGSDDPKVLIWDLDSDYGPYALTGQYGPIHSVAISANGCRAISSSWDQSLVTWELFKESNPRVLSGYQDVYEVSLSADGNLALLGDKDGTLILVDLCDEQEAVRLTDQAGKITTIAFHPNGALAASSSRANTLRVWDLHKARCLAEFDCEGEIIDMVFHPEGYQIIAAVRNRGVMRLFLEDNETADQYDPVG